VDAWVFEFDEPIEKITFDKREVCEVMWATAEAIREMAASGELLDNIWYPYFEEMLNKWTEAI